MRKSGTTHIAALLREMATVGVPVDSSAVESDVEISQKGAICDTMVFDLPDGRAGCIIDICILNRSSKSISVRSVELHAPWLNSKFEWLQDPKNPGGDPLWYGFPGEGAPLLPRNQVINHHLLEHRILRPRRPLEGWLLAVGDPKPEELLPGGLVDFRLTIVGSDDCEYSETISLRVDSLWKDERRSSRKSSTGGLFGKARGRNLGSQKSDNDGRSTNANSIGHAPRDTSTGSFSGKMSHFSKNKVPLAEKPRRG